MILTRRNSYAVDEYICDLTMTLDKLAENKYAEKHWHYMLLCMNRSQIGKGYYYAIRVPGRTVGEILVSEDNIIKEIRMTTESGIEEDKLKELDVFKGRHLNVFPYYSGVFVISENNTNVDFAIYVNLIRAITYNNDSFGKIHFMFGADGGDMMPDDTIPISPRSYDFIIHNGKLKPAINSERDQLRKIASGYDDGDVIIDAIDCLSQYIFDVPLTECKIKQRIFKELLKETYPVPTEVKRMDSLTVSATHIMKTAVEIHPIIQSCITRTYESFETIVGRQQP